MDVFEIDLEIIFLQYEKYHTGTDETKMSFPADWVLGNRKSMSLPFSMKSLFLNVEITNESCIIVTELPVFYFFSPDFYSRFMQMPACVFKANIDAVSFGIFLYLYYTFMFFYSVLICLLLRSSTDFQIIVLQ